MLKEIFKDYKRILFEKTVDNDEDSVKQRSINFLQKEIEFQNSQESNSKIIKILLKTLIEVIIPIIIIMILVKVTKTYYIENMAIIQVLIVLFLIALQSFLYMFILRIIINNTIQLVNSRIKEKARMTKLIFAIPICEIVIGLILCVPIYNALYELI